MSELQEQEPPVPPTGTGELSNRQALMLVCGLGGMATALAMGDRTGWAAIVGVVSFVTAGIPIVELMHSNDSRQD